MAIVVEDGTGLPTANSYAAEATLSTYCDDRGITLATGDAEAALVRASAWIDNTYRSQFMGYRVKLREQGLEWPRVGVVDSSGFMVLSTAVPVEVVQATCEAAIRELRQVGSLAPDLTRGGAIKEAGAGSARVVFADNAPANKTFQVIDGILSALLAPANQYTSRAGRA